MDPREEVPPDEVLRALDLLEPDCDAWLAYLRAEGFQLPACEWLRLGLDFKVEPGASGARARPRSVSAVAGREREDEFGSPFLPFVDEAGAAYVPRSGGRAVWLVSAALESFRSGRLAEGRSSRSVARVSVPGFGKCSVARFRDRPPLAEAGYVRDLYDVPCPSLAEPCADAPGARHVLAAILAGGKDAEYFRDLARGAPSRDGALLLVSRTLPLAAALLAWGDQGDEWVRDATRRHGGAQLLVPADRYGRFAEAMTDWLALRSLDEIPFELSTDGPADEEGPRFYEATVLAKVVAADALAEQGPQPGISVTVEV
jgi:hypothetical protein